MNKIEELEKKVLDKQKKLEMLQIKNSNLLNVYSDSKERLDKNSSEIEELNKTYKELIEIYNNIEYCKSNKKSFNTASIILSSFLSLFFVLGLIFPYIGIGISIISIIFGISGNLLFVVLKRNYDKVLKELLENNPNINEKISENLNNLKELLNTNQLELKQHKNIEIELDNLNLDIEKLSYSLEELVSLLNKIKTAILHKTSEMPEFQSLLNDIYLLEVGDSRKLEI